MPSYRCYFFGQGDQPNDRQRIYSAAHTIDARTDSEALVKAHAIYRNREAPHGFEVWQSETLVSRHPAPKEQAAEETAPQGAGK